MNKRTLDKAIREAKRFLEIAATVRKQMDEQEMFFLGTKDTAQCRRTSLDLTRALADMRRPG